MLVIGFLVLSSVVGPKMMAGEPLVPLASVRAALADADLQLEPYVREWVRIAEIPAPSGGEGQRADYLETRLRDLGLSRVGRDEAGNVFGLLKGSNPALKKVVFSAHMDTVAPAGADYSVRRTQQAGGGVLRGPGVRDDSSGLAALVAAISLIRNHDLAPAADTWILASAQEEVGLQGAERFVRDHADEIGAFIAVDGSLGQISYAATGIVWLKIRFKGEAAHTLKAHEKPSAILAAARAIDAISAIPLRRSPEELESWLNIGSMGAGDVPNALPGEAWFTVDIRSNDTETVGMLEKQVTELAGRASRGVGVECHIETLHRLAGTSPPGGGKSPLVLSARRVLESLGWNQISVTPRGTADHNVAIARGIPGIAIGITTGDGAHTPDEYADIAPFLIGVKQVMLLALVPLTGTR
jgi:acetylornithine deacetylase/succinyl-diaminopimelate desuccinylase-like protein